uniref:Uncharacterized protein n=1 Tax=Solanum lycopersicum TaxID=4081 RepID=A0A3Q7FBH5_SOLLC
VLVLSTYFFTSLSPAAAVSPPPPVTEELSRVSIHLRFSSNGWRQRSESQDGS